ASILVRGSWERSRRTRWTASSTPPPRPGAGHTTSVGRDRRPSSSSRSPLATSTPNGRRRSLRRQPRRRGHHELAEQAVRFAEWTSGEEQRVGRSGGRAVTERNGPQAVDRDRRAGGGVTLAPRPP